MKRTCKKDRSRENMNKKDYEMEGDIRLRIDHNSIFGQQDLINQAKFNQNQISIPLHSDLSNKEISLIVNTAKKG